MVSSRWLPGGNWNKTVNPADTDGMRAAGSSGRGWAPVSTWPCRRQCGSIREPACWERLLWALRGHVGSCGHASRASASEHGTESFPLREQGDNTPTGRVWTWNQKPNLGMHRAGWATEGRRRAGCPHAWPRGRSIRAVEQGRSPGSVMWPPWPSASPPCSQTLWGFFLPFLTKELMNSCVINS